MHDGLRAWLRDRGASDGEVARAEAEAWLPLLVIDRLLMPGAGRYDAAELARRADVDEAIARRMWRALGFPDAPEDFPTFTDADVVALRLAVERAEIVGGVEDLVRQARVTGSTLARIASVEADVIAENLQRLRDAGASDAEAAQLLVDQLDWASLAHLIDYTHRLQLRAALWRRMLRGEGETMVDLGIGFADLAGYTRLSEHLETDRLRALLSAWEALAHDTVTETGARVVKTIGDEVMFVGLPDAVAHSATELCRRAKAAAELPDVRVGIAVGPVLARDGDFYGPTVNLASRLTALAHRSTVCAPAATRDRLRRDPRLEWRRVGPRRIRGIGEVVVYRVRVAPNRHGPDAG